MCDALKIGPMNTPYLCLLGPNQDHHPIPPVHHPPIHPAPYHSVFVAGTTFLSGLKYLLFGRSAFYKARANAGVSRADPAEATKKEAKFFFSFKEDKTKK